MQSEFLRKHGLIWNSTQGADFVLMWFKSDSGQQKLITDSRSSCQGVGTHGLKQKLTADVRLSR